MGDTRAHTDTHSGPQLAARASKTSRSRAPSNARRYPSGHNNGLWWAWHVAVCHFQMCRNTGKHNARRLLHAPMKAKDNEIQGPWHGPRDVHRYGAPRWIRLCQSRLTSVHRGAESLGWPHLATFDIPEVNQERNRGLCHVGRFSVRRDCLSVWHNIQTTRHAASYILW